MGRSALPSRFLTAEESRKVLDAIRAAEAKTSGEIRVHLDRKCKGDAEAAAKRAFEKIGMAATAEKNGVMLYLAVADHAFAVIGDSGIDAKVERDFWDRVRDSMSAAFREDRFGDGLANAVAEIGTRLAQSFPRKDGDRNELSDDISTGDAS